MRKSIWHAPCIESGVAQSWARRKKGNRQMSIFESAREIATALAAAFITAMLFVSSATSLLPIA